MRQTLRAVITLAVGLAPGLVPGVAAADEPVAIVDGIPITSEALEATIHGQVLELRQREDQLRRKGLEELIAQALLDREAAAQGVSVAELTRTEITNKARVSPAEAKQFYEANRARFGGVGEAEAIQQIVTGLGRQREGERRAAFALELRDKYPVEVRLEPFRLDVGTGDGPVRGSADAPVTIVEFSDFQCPYCVRARPALKRVREVYGDEVRFAFRHFPLAFHQQAQKAGEAASCAGDQDRFWEMHDRLWANSSKLLPAELKEHATAGVTLSMKNLFGIAPPTIYGAGAGEMDPAPVPNGGRVMFHTGNRQPPRSAPPEIAPGTSHRGGYRVPRIVVDLVASRPIDLALIDGINTMTGGEGPWLEATQARPLRIVSPGILVAGRNPVTTDAVSMKLMGFDPMATRGAPPFEHCDSMLALAEEKGIGTRDPRRIEVAGPPLDDLAVNFRAVSG